MHFEQAIDMVAAESLAAWVRNFPKPFSHSSRGCIGDRSTTGEALVANKVLAALRAEAWTG